MSHEGMQLARPFKLTESVIADGCREIAIGGELDLAVAGRLQEMLARCQGEQVLISLEACEFIDSTGLAVILDANRDGRSRVLLHSPHDQVLRILEVTGLTANCSPAKSTVPSATSSPTTSAGESTA